MDTYTVAAPRKVLDHEPGSTFEADIPAKQEKFLLEIGALVKGESTSDQGGGEKPLADKTREELNDLARATAGVPEPEKLPNKEAVIDAIEKAAAEQKGEAQS